MIRRESGSGRRVRVAVDGMGGDYAPTEVVSGAARAVREMDVEVIITGLRPDLMAELKKHGLHDSTIQLVEAVEVVKDGENAIIAAMRKPNSSMAIATKLVKEGKADAVVSAGSTGAFMVNAYQHLGCLPGIERPIVGGAFLKLAPNTFMLDMGANVGCQASDLLKFAVAGTVFVRKFHGIENPTVGLLNVGAEEGKGTEVVKEAYQLLKDSGLNFIGNVEGMDIPAGKANVIVCDGFIGNILLKYSEGIARGVNRFLSEELAMMLPQPAVEAVTSKLMKLISTPDTTGGGPIWGINGVAIVCHGASRADHIAAAIGEAKLAVETDFVGALRAELEKALGGAAT
ncbi:MAG: phosphate acyltransferase PlsX [Dehalococcoidia bacterium]|nr:phosphate acyltransferase PlsX [Dehalococcoidia bacterium]